MLIGNGQLLESVVYHLPFGIMVVDAQRKVLAANRAAKDILQAGDALVERQSVLRATGARTTSASHRFSPRLRLFDQIRHGAAASVFHADLGNPHIRRSCLRYSTPWT